MVRLPPGLWVLALVAVSSLAGCTQAYIDPEIPTSQPVTPVVQFRDERDPYVVVQAIGVGFEWSTLGVQADRAGTKVIAGDSDAPQPAVEVSTSNTEFTRPSSATKDIMAGDYLRFCADQGLADAVTFTIADTQTNTIVHRVTYSDFPTCT